MSGGLQLFQSCFASGSYIYIQTAEDYSEVYNPITIQIDNITNFAPGITSGLVSI